MFQEDQLLSVPPGVFIRRYIPTDQALSQGAGGTKAEKVSEQRRAKLFPLPGHIIVHILIDQSSLGHHRGEANPDG